MNVEPRPQSSLLHTDPTGVVPTAKAERRHQPQDPFRPTRRSADAAVLRVDSLGRIEFWNCGAEIFFGIRSEEVQGESFLSLFPNHAHERVHDAFAEAQRGYAPRIEVAVFRLGQPPTEASVGLSPLPGGGAVVTIEDVRRYQKLIRESRALRQAAERRASSMATILKAVRDELAACDLAALAGGLASSEAQERVQRAATLADWLEHMVDAEVEETPSPAKLVDMGQLLEQCLGPDDVSHIDEGLYRPALIATDLVKSCMRWARSADQGVLFHAVFQVRHPARAVVRVELTPLEGGPMELDDRHLSALQSHAARLGGAAGKSARGGVWWTAQVALASATTLDPFPRALLGKRAFVITETPERSRAIAGRLESWTLRATVMDADTAQDRLDGADLLVLSPEALDSFADCDVPVVVVGSPGVRTPLKRGELYRCVADALRDEPKAAD